MVDRTMSDIVEETTALQCDGDELSVAVRRAPANTSQASPPALMIHGAGQATKERSRPVSELLAQYGLDSVAFDHVGHGGSTGEMVGQTLLARLRQATLVAGKFDARSVLVGFSMGGFTALQLATAPASRGRFDKLLLFYPAVYPDDALDAPFGDGFSEAIRRKDAWQGSELFTRLGNFVGKVLIAIGSDDSVIPDELPSAVMSSLGPRAEGRTHVVPGAPHLMLPVLFEDEALLEGLRTETDWLLR